jgi:hypothetical protein
MADDRTHGLGAGPEDGLDALLAEARRIAPGDDLVARVLADAETARQEVAAPAPPARPAGLWVRPPAWIAALGGWGGFGGVTAAGLVGLALGFWSPDMVDVISGGQLHSLSGGGVSPNLVELALESGDV